VILPKSMRPRPDLEALLDPAPGVSLFRVGGVLPRVYLAPASAPTPDGEALTAIFDPQVVAGKHAVLASTPAAPPTLAMGEASAGALGQCQLRVFRHAQVEADCEVLRPGLAVFLEQYDEGWSATVDGQRAPLLRANLVMRAVPLERGRHRVVLRFSPLGLPLGVALSGLGLIAFAVFLVLGRPSLGTRR
jgi:hypothetical protein